MSFHRNSLMCIVLPSSYEQSTEMYADEISGQ